MYEDVYIQHDPCRTVQVQPEVIKVLDNGMEIVSYYWEGAEIAYWADRGYSTAGCNPITGHLRL